jgi:type II secretory pathway pseudopilin PulG
MNFIDNSKPGPPQLPASRSTERGFTIMETAVALVIMMVIGLGAAALFAYATNANSGATDRELAMAVAQKRMEWLRNMPFSSTTRNLAYSYPNGGLGATAGTTETETSSGRSYSVVTRIDNTSVVPVGLPDAGQPTVKTISITVTPQGAGLALGWVSLSSQRSTLVPGTY